MLDILLDLKGLQVLKGFKDLKVLKEIKEIKALHNGSQQQQGFIHCLMLV